MSRSEAVAIKSAVKIIGCFISGAYIRQTLLDFLLWIWN